MRPGVAVLIALAGCGGKVVPDQAFLASLPPQDRLRIGVGGTSGRNAALERAEAQPAPLAQLYVATRLTSEQLNGIVGASLGTLWSVASGPPSAIDDGRAVWGPFTPPLSPVTYRLVIVRAEADHFYFELDGRPKASDAESAFVPLIQGEGDANADGHAGGFKLLLTARHDLDPVGTPQTGSIEARFQLEAAKGSLQLHLQDVAGAGAPALTGDYLFDQAADGSGDFRFGARAVLPDGTAGQGAIRSRWTSSGAGRGDATVQAPDGAKRISECWNASFVRVFFSLGSDYTEGDPAACAFADALPPDA